MSDSEVEEQEVKVPNHYSGLIEFINDNKQDVINTPSLYLKVLKAMDSLLIEAKNMSDLHRDTSIILDAIKMQQDALIKEYKNDLSPTKLIQMANDDELEFFYIDVIASCSRVKFIDFLDFNYNVRPQRQKIVRKKYENSKEVAITPGKLKEIEEESASTRAINKIKKVVEERSEIEYFKLITDPNSYSRTITNAFNLALAIRMKAVSFCMQNDVLKIVPYSQRDGSNDHSVLELTPAQHKNIVKKFNITESLI